MPQSPSPEMQQQVNKSKAVIAVPVELPSIEGLGVERDCGRIARSGTTDVDFPSKLHPGDGKDWASVGTGQGEDILLFMFQQVKDTCAGRGESEVRKGSLIRPDGHWPIKHHQNAHPRWARAALLEGEQSAKKLCFLEQVSCNKHFQKHPIWLCTLTYWLLPNKFSENLTGFLTLH